MRPDKSIIYTNALIVNDGERFEGYVVVSGDTIAEVGRGDFAGVQSGDTAQVVDCRGDMLLPGAIDTHVHFRDPGLTQKGDIESESRAAVAGGVTSYLDMPNTRPATVDISAWTAKMERAAACSHANYGFYIGATNDNIDELLSLDYSRIPGIKLFLGSSTGNMLVDDSKTLGRLFGESKALIAVHAEDEDTIRANRARLEAEYPDGDVPLSLHSTMRSSEACLKAARRAVDAARHAGARLHLLHVSTAAELDLLDKGPVTGKRITAETCPHYLIFANDDINSRGARVKCNPAIKESPDRAALMQAVKDGLIDTVATDHAPHLPADKEGDLLHAASGMPGVQFSLPLMLSSGLEPELVVRLMSHNPALLYAIEDRGFIRPGYKADIVRVRRLGHPHVISDSDVLSKCGWTPYAGIETTVEVVTTMVSGRVAYDSGAVVPGVTGEPLRFGRR